MRKGKKGKGITRTEEISIGSSWAKETKEKINKWD